MTAARERELLLELADCRQTILRATRRPDGTEWDLTRPDAEFRRAVRGLMDDGTVGGDGSGDGDGDGDGDRGSDSPRTAAISHLARRYEEIRGLLAMANSRLVAYIARRYLNRGVSPADLMQEGFCGLLEAIDRFDPVNTTRLATYASWWIRQALAARRRRRRLSGPADPQAAPTAGAVLAATRRLCPARRPRGGRCPAARRRPARDLLGAGRSSGGRFLERARGHPAPDLARCHLPHRRRHLAGRALRLRPGAGPRKRRFLRIRGLPADVAGPPRAAHPEVAVRPGRPPSPFAQPDRRDPRHLQGTGPPDPGAPPSSGCARPPACSASAVRPRTARDTQPPTWRRSQPELRSRALYSRLAHTGDPLIRPSGTFSPAGRRGWWTSLPSGEGAAARESGRPPPRSRERGGVRGSACAQRIREALDASVRKIGL